MRRERELRETLGPAKCTPVLLLRPLQLYKVDGDGNAFFLLSFYNQMNYIDKIICIGKNILTIGIKLIGLIVID